VQDAVVPKGFRQLGAPFTPNPFVLDRQDEVRWLKPPGFRMYRDTDLPKGWQWLAPSAYGMRDYRKMAIPWMMRDAKTLRLYAPPVGSTWSLELPDWMVQSAGDHPREVFVTAKPSASPVGEYRVFKIGVDIGTTPRQWIVGRLLEVTWHVRWFKWFRNDHNAFADTAGWAALFAGPALKEEDLPDLPEVPGNKAPEPGLPADHFALVGTTQIRLDAGLYQFDTVSDDGIQVLVDGKTVVDNWTHHGATSDSGRLALGGGVHRIEVHYCQEDGGAALRVRWTKL
jgi:hypothetical protein